MKKSYQAFTIISFAVFIALFMFINAFATEDIRILINGEELATDTPPRIINGRTMAPVRAVSEAINCNVEWSEPDKRVDIYTPDGFLFLSMNIDDAVVTRYNANGTADGAPVEYVTIDSPPVIIDGRTLVPLRFIAEAFDFMVGWDEDTGTVTCHQRILYDYDFILASAGADDILMFYTEPSKSVILLSGAERAVPEPKATGCEILIANVYIGDINFAYFDLFPDPGTESVIWECILSPGESVLLDTQYSEGIPNRGLDVRLYDENSKDW